MTKTLERFLRQYNATGREKGDGYDASHFEGLAAEELHTVEDMLIKDALKLDTTAIQGLGVINTANAETALRQLLTIVLPPNYAHLRVVQALWEISHDLALQEELLKDYFCNNNELRRLSAIALLYTRPSPIFYDVFIEILKAFDNNEDLRITAVRGILFYYGILRTAHDHVNFQKYLPLVRLLSNASDEKELSLAIAEIKKEAAKLKGEMELRDA